MSAPKPARAIVAVSYWITCRTGKRSYASKSDARLAKRQAGGAGMKGWQKLNAYRCVERDCDDWHLGRLHDDTKRGTAV